MPKRLNVFTISLSVAVYAFKTCCSKLLYYSWVLAHKTQHWLHSHPSNTNWKQKKRQLNKTAHNRNKCFCSIKIYTAELLPCHAVKWHPFSRYIIVNWMHFAKRMNPTHTAEQQTLMVHTEKFCQAFSSDFRWKMHGISHSRYKHTSPVREIEQSDLARHTVLLHLSLLLLDMWSNFLNKFPKVE